MTYAWAVGFLYLVSAVLILILQVSGQTDGSWFSALRETLTETRWGRIWTLRIIIGGATVLLFMAAAWWWPKRQWITLAGLLALSAALPLPHALISHASASRYGRTGAIVADYAHLLAMALWIGGLALMLVMISSARDLTGDGQRAVLARALPRFSAIALTCWVVLGLTGFYSGYLQIGSLDGLFDTAYGRALVYKLITLALTLAIAAFNLLVVSRRLQRPSADGGAWWRRFAGLISLELVGVLIVLIFVGRMTGMEPARSVLGERDNQQAVTFALGDREATLSLAPGAVGPNHFRLDISGEPLPSEATATLLLTPPLDMAGQKSLNLDRVSPNAYEGHSAEVSVVGDWNITVSVSQIGAFQLQGDLVYPAPERQPPGPSIALPSWTVNTTGIFGLVIIIAGAVALVAGWRATSRSGRREGLGLGTVAVIAGVFLIVQGRTDVASAGVPLDTPNPVPVTDQAIQVGESTYAANCIACHGVGAAGDGPAGADLNPPPANLLEGHALFHSDAEFFNWIRNGKPGTAMPAFSETLTDEQIWSTIHYLRTLQQDQAAGLIEPEATPLASASPDPVP
jgi:copper transport protein